MKREKTGGRQKGTPNKKTEELRQSIRTFLDENWQSIQSVYDLLEAKDKLQFIDKMLSYSLPKLQAIQVHTDFESMSDEQLDHVINSLKSET